MAPKSAAALVLLAAMIASLAPPLQAQRDVNFFTMINRELCSDDDAMKSCARELVKSRGTIPPDCCGALLKAVTSGEGKRRCACGFWSVAAEMLGVDVDEKCQPASNVGVAGGSSKLEDLCVPVPGS